MLTAKGFLFRTVVGWGDRWYGNSGRLSESFEIAFLSPNLNDSVVVGQLRMNNNNTNWFLNKTKEFQPSGDIWGWKWVIVHGDFGNNYRSRRQQL